MLLNSSGLKLFNSSLNTFFLFAFILDCIYIYTKDNKWAPYDLVILPVKYKVEQNADTGLIVKSCQELNKIAFEEKWNKIIIPRPGCGLGGLNWEDVKRVIEPILDDRFFIISNI